MPVRPFPRPARRARAVSAAIGRFDHPPSTEVHSKRPLQLLPLLRTSRWRLMEVTPQYVYPPHQPRQRGSHRRSSLPPDFVHRCARHARTHAQLAADCAVGQAAAATSAAPIASTSQLPAAQVWLLSGHRCTLPAHAHALTGLRPGRSLQSGDADMATNASDAGGSESASSSMDKWRAPLRRIMAIILDTNNNNDNDSHGEGCC